MDGEIDWKTVGGKIAEEQRSGVQGDRQTYKRVRQLLIKMSAEDLSAQLDVIATLNLDDGTRMQLNSMIIDILAEKDPEMLLGKLSGELADEQSPIERLLQHSLENRAKTDPTAAADWLDSQIAAGKFQGKRIDGRNRLLLSMESVVVNQLLKSDPASATARLMALPEDECEKFFRNGFHGQVDAQTDGAMAKLIRDTFPPDKVADVLAHQAGNIAMLGSYERVEGFIARANVSEEEKNAIVASVMESKVVGLRGGERTINGEALDSARA